jgi:hypothetical protein
MSISGLNRGSCIPNDWTGFFGCSQNIAESMSIMNGWLGPKITLLALLLFLPICLAGLNFWGKHAVFLVFAYK